MPSGKIKYFNKEKGYGFITQDNGGREVFIHISHIRIHQREIVEGQRVEYEIAIGPKGPEAREVVIFQEIEPKSETIDIDIDRDIAVSACFIWIFSARLTPAPLELSVAVISYQLSAFLSLVFS